ncbi:hypothetical protein OUZ56_010449 [Daphnia magna]|uniref:Uncharacterized protein n=1 Tax=Daphnia magna TaxID=35525 RepID=A0ABR0AIP2_9CRUS|nr:hypothetical protein OUZ56_010449 [Daphnia magna]
MYRSRRKGPRGQIPQVGIQPWQLSIRSWSIGMVEKDSILRFIVMIKIHSIELANVRSCQFDEIVKKKLDTNSRVYFL